MLKKYFLQGDFSKNVGVVLAGTVLAQLIPLAAAPFLTRMYLPEQFGWLALLLAIVNPLSVIASGRYEVAVVLPKEDAKAASIVSISFLFSLGFSVLTFLIVYFFHDLILARFNDPGLVYILYFIAPFLLLMGIFAPNNYWLQRKKAFKRIAVNKIAQTSSIALFSLLLGWFGYENGLTTGYIMGWTVIMLFSVYQIFQTGFRFSGRNREAMREYSEFPLYNMLPAFLYTAAASIPIFIISRSYSAETTGHFNLCRQMLLIPTSLVASAFTQVYYERIAGKKALGEKIFPDFIRLVRFLAFIAVGLFAFIFFLGPVLFKVIFGSQWEISGQFASILILSTCMQFLVLPVSTAFPVLGKIKYTSIWQVFYFLSMAATWFLRNEPIGSYLLYFTLIETVCYLLYLLWIVREIKKHDNQL